jgi:hypothetical protein
MITMLLMKFQSNSASIKLNSYNVKFAFIGLVILFYFHLNLNLSIK